jgi:hypothetical protein
VLKKVCSDLADGIPPLMENVEKATPSMIVINEDQKEDDINLPLFIPLPDPLKV